MNTSTTQDEEVQSGTAPIEEFFDMMRRASESSAELPPMPSLEQQEDVLEDFLERYLDLGDSDFEVGDLVTVRPGTSYVGEGEMFKVIERYDPPILDAGEESGTFFMGLRYDLRVAVVRQTPAGPTVLTYPYPSWALVAYEPPIVEEAVPDDATQAPVAD